MHFEITSLKFDLDELEQNPDKKAQVERALFERFAAQRGDHALVFEGMTPKASRYRAKFVGKPGVTMEQVHAWLVKQGFHGFSIDIILD